MKNEIAKKVKISKKLLEIAEHVEGKIVADVGCDHGYLSIYLALKKDVLVYACDVRKGPLKRAIKNAREFGVMEKIKFFLTDGLKGVPCDANCIVVAGMGGKLISRIVFENSWLKNKDIKLILQPQSFIFHFRKELYLNGFEIEKEIVVLENNKWYDIFVVRFSGEFRKITLKEAVCGKLMKRKDKMAAEYLKYCYNKEYLVLEGLKKSKNLENRKKEEQVEKILKILKKEL